MEFFQRIYFFLVAANVTAAPATSSHRWPFGGHKAGPEPRGTFVFKACNLSNIGEEILGHVFHVWLHPHRMEWFIMSQIFKVKWMILEMYLEKKNEHISTHESICKPSVFQN